MRQTAGYGKTATNSLGPKLQFCWGKNRGPQWPHSDPAPLEPQVEQDQGDGLVSTLVYLTASLNRQING